MKKFVRKSVFVAMLVLASTVNVFATGGNHGITIAGEKMLNLKIKFSDGITDIYVFDQSGTVLFKDIFKGVDYSKNYDFSTLPSGIYQIKLVGQTRNTFIPLNVYKNKLVLGKSKIQLKPTVRIDRNKVFITHLALKGEPIEIIINDFNAVNIYREKLQGQRDLGRILDFSKLPNGLYNVKVKTEGNTFEKEIKKENGNLF
ncbi:MAG: hypothetical protein ACWA42_11395 [Lutibacter sp.]